MPKWWDDLNVNYYKLLDRWCEKHNECFESDLWGCPKCAKERTDEYVATTRRRWAEEEKIKTLEKMAIVEKTLDTVRELASKAESIEEFNEMLAQCSAFKYRS